MAKRLKFENFRNSLEQRELPMDSLGHYVEFDSESPVPKLRFKSDALLDVPDPSYDVDLAIYRYSRELRKREPPQVATLQSSDVRSVVAEGDSWYNLPSFWRPPAIADCIEENPRFDMRNIAYWGHTLASIVHDREHIEVMKENTPDFFMLCGGGNDIQEGLAGRDYVHQYDSKRAHDDYLTQAGIDGIAEVGKGYKDILSEVIKKFPEVKVFCHGYDYPRPLVGHGDYIGKYLRKLKIPDDSMDKIVKPIVDLLNTTIETVANSYPSVKFIDLRNESAEYLWRDDMHPDADGFQALAKKFEDAMSLGSTMASM